jgi:hypothetical protein
MTQQRTSTVTLRRAEQDLPIEATLTRKLYEGFGDQGVKGKAVGLIGRRMSLERIRTMRSIGPEGAADRTSGIKRIARSHGLRGIGANAKSSAARRPRHDTGTIAPATAGVRRPKQRGPARTNGITSADRAEPDRFPAESVESDPFDSLTS